MNHSPSHNERTITNRFRIAGALLLSLVFLTAGCGPGQTTGQRAVVQQQRNFLDVAMDYLSRLEEYETQQGMLQVAYNLNHWLPTAKEEIGWQKTSMVDDLPDYLKIPPLQDLAEREVTVDDVQYMREASWMQSIGQWVVEEADQWGEDEWLNSVEESHGEPHAYEVAVASALFDWTVRNIQLEATPELEAETRDERSTALRQAQPGPGYQTFPWQTLLFGRGDYLQRARVFIGLCRQQEIDVVMLAFADSRDERPRPWLPAALIDDQLYLFDTQLGIPIPGPGDKGIVTLKQVRQNPQLLRDLDVGSAHPYPVQEDNLEHLVALIDASPEALSWRMAMINSQPTTAQQLTLAVDADRIAEQVADVGITNVRLWQCPLETFIYRQSLMARAAVDRDLAFRLLLDEWIFDGDTPMVAGRKLHLRGKFETVDDQKGAKGKYLDCRVYNALIEQLTTSPEVQQSMGFQRGRLNDAQWETKLQNAKDVVIRTKQNATYWLALIHYETGEYENARDWFDVRCLQAYENGPWTAGARYNLARVYEQLGDLEAAHQTYLLDDSPQKHGNLLRARKLRKQIESASPDS